MSNDENMIYNIYLQNCNEDNIGEVIGNDSQCKNITEINKYFRISKGNRTTHNQTYINNTKKFFIYTL